MPDSPSDTPSRLLSPHMEQVQKSQPDVIADPRSFQRTAAIGRQLTLVVGVTDIPPKCARPGGSVAHHEVVVIFRAVAPLASTAAWPELTLAIAAIRRLSGIDIHYFEARNYHHYQRFAILITPELQIHSCLIPTLGSFQWPRPTWRNLLAKTLPALASLLVRDVRVCSNRYIHFRKSTSRWDHMGPRRQSDGSPSRQA
jgi:hypothetical protein